MSNRPPARQNSANSPPRPEVLKLSPDEIRALQLLREMKHQELVIKVQDGVIVCIKRTETWVKKKGGLL